MTITNGDPGIRVVLVQVNGRTFSRIVKPGAEVTIDVEHVMTGGRTIRGIIEGDTNPDVFLPKLIELHRLGRFPIEKLVTFYPFWDINQVIEDFLSGKCVKPILRF